MIICCPSFSKFFFHLSHIRDMVMAGHWAGVDLIQAGRGLLPKAERLKHRNSPNSYN